MQDLQTGASWNMFFTGSSSIWRTKNTLYKTDTSTYCTSWYMEFITLSQMTIIELFSHLSLDSKSGIWFWKWHIKKFSQHGFITCLQLEPPVVMSPTTQSIISYTSSTQRMRVRTPYKWKKITCNITIKMELLASEWPSTSGMASLTQWWQRRTLHWRKWKQIEHYVFRLEQSIIMNRTKLACKNITQFYLNHK